MTDAAELVALAKSLLPEGVASRVTIERTQHGTVKIVAEAGEQQAAPVVMVSGHKRRGSR